MIVHDSSSILAYINNERGANLVRTALPDSLISAVNYSEVIQKIVQQGRDTTFYLERFAQLKLEVSPFDATQARLAAELYPNLSKLGLSLGDRACFALALTKYATIYTADEVWLQAPFELEIIYIRREPQ